MRIQREEKGITLITLIITMIVLLILAGVSIAMLTGENGILKRAESVKVAQSKAELTEKMQLAIMESLIDRENSHTIDNVLKIAEENGYIAIGNTHRLMNAVPEESVLETSTETNKYVTEECETVLVVDVETGVWVELGQNGSDVTLEVGETLIKVENLRSLSVVATAGQLTNGKVTITVEAMLNDEPSKEKSSIEKIIGPDGQEITTNKEVFDGSNGDKNLRVTYDVTENGNYTFTATEENGGKATKSIAVSEFDNVEEIEITSDTEKGEWTDEVNVTIEYDEWTNESLQYKVGTGSWQTAGNTRQVVTVTENTTIEARYGTDDTTKVTYTVAEIDDEVPTPPEFTIEEIATTSFKIKIGKKATDEKSGLKEYQIYNGAEKIGTIGATATEHTVQNLTEGTTYLIKLVAVDEVGNEAESGVESVTTEKPTSGQLSKVVEVGDYIAYDAGEWTQADFNLITASSGSPTVNGTTSLATTQGQFGGFTIGQSRNSNSTEFNTSYKPRTEGWRVWSIEGDEVTIVHAGHSESYYHATNSSVATTNILRNRNTEMYENEYAESSRIMEGTDAVDWYNTQYGTNYTMVDYGADSSTFYYKTFSTAGAIEVLENGSYYWLAAPCSSNGMYYVGPNNRGVYDGRNGSFGVRVLVSLKSEVQTSGVNENGELELM